MENVPKSLHKCRKTYATRLINARVDESVIRSQMGHIDFSTTRGFYYFNNRNEDEARKMVMEALVTNSNLT
ncbi:MAG: tyrosine-type recombinase/integrase [Lachnospiraceae bacterium]|nr:tyrosine-type recombinase/integrase [Lachnospiraceae bacterium]